MTYGSSASLAGRTSQLAGERFPFEPQSQGKIQGHVQETNWLLHQSNLR